MKVNLKTLDKILNSSRLPALSKIVASYEWKEAFEKELREIYDDIRKTDFNWTPDYLTLRKFIKEEILGE